MRVAAVRATAVRELVFRPVTVIPYIFGALCLLLGLFAALSCAAPWEAGSGLFLGAVGIVFTSAGIVSIVSRLAGYPRLRLQGDVLSLERYFSRTERRDLAALGNAIVIPDQNSLAWHLGFPDAREEQALRMRGNAGQIDRHTVRYIIPITAIVGFSERKARHIASAINSARLPDRVSMTHAEITRINKRVIAKHNIILGVLCVLGVAALFVLWRTGLK